MTVDQPCVNAGGVCPIYLPKKIAIQILGFGCSNNCQCLQILVWYQTNRGQIDRKGHPRVHKSCKLSSLLNLDIIATEYLLRFLEKTYTWSISHSFWEDGTDQKSFFFMELKVTWQVAFFAKKSEDSHIIKFCFCWRHFWMFTRYLNISKFIKYLHLSSGAGNCAKRI